MTAKNQARQRRRWQAGRGAVALATALIFTGSVGTAPTPAAAAAIAPKIQTPANWQFKAGGYSVFTVVATGSPTPTLSVSGTLPPGIRSQTTRVGALVFFGTAPANIAGRSYTVTVTASNGTSPNAVQDIVMTSGTKPTTTSLSVSPNPPTAGQTVNYYVRISPRPNGGQVTVFRADGSPLPGCIGFPVSASPLPGEIITAGCHSLWLPAGTQNLYAVYSGFGSFLPSRSPGTKRVVVNPAPPAYWLLSRNGDVFGLGGASSFGGNAQTSAARAIAPGRGGGIYVVGAGGGVFTVGSGARYFGSVPGLGKRVSNIVDIVPTPDGKGYWVVGSDGGVFSFGSARFYGSVPGLGIRNQHIVGMVASPTGLGYTLVGQDGGVFTFGDTRFYGSVPGLGIHVRSIRAVVQAPGGTGYALVGADGGVFKFGTGLRFQGSLPGRGVKVDNIVGIALTPDGDGYYLAGSDGTVYGFGNAKVQPRPPRLNSSTLPLVAIASQPAPSLPLGMAQGTFQRMAKTLSQDRFAMLSASTVASVYDLGNNNPLDSTVTFQCSTCGPSRQFKIQWFKSHADAVGWAVTHIQTALQSPPAQPFRPQYVAGSAVMGPENPTSWPPPARVVNAFGIAVGQPVETVMLP